MPCSRKRKSECLSPCEWVVGKGCKTPPPRVDRVDYSDKKPVVVTDSEYEIEYKFWGLDLERARMKQDQLLHAITHLSQHVLNENNSQRMQIWADALGANLLSLQECFAEEFEVHGPWYEKADIPAPELIVRNKMWFTSVLASTLARAEIARRVALLQEYIDTLQIYEANLMRKFLQMHNII